MPAIRRRDRVPTMPLPLAAPKSKSSALALLVLLAVAPSVRATALFVVGAGGTQAGCGYATIQQAVTAEAAYHGDNDYIYITRSQTYTAQAIMINGQDVHIIGGVDDCNHYTPSGNTIVSGSGGAANSVISIRGNSNVTISNLLISGGDDGAANSGGGVDFAGTGSLAIDHTTVSNNHAGYGGGINFNGSGGSAELDIGTETLITNNTAATSGGGIRIEGNALLRALAPQTLIAFNDALGGYGGGIEVIGPARADLGSPGYRFAEYVGLLYNNTAQYGGGLSVHETGLARLFTTDARAPMRIQGNSAAHTGGGIYLQSTDHNGHAFVCGTDYRLDDNSAQEGSAVYVDEVYSTLLDVYTGAVVYFNRIDNCGGVPIASLGGVTCVAGECNSIDGNVAQDSAGNPTQGSAVLVQTNSLFAADRIRLQANQGAHVLRAVGGGDEVETTHAQLENCLITGNVSGSDLVLAESPTYLTLANCTLANNQIATGAVVRSADTLSLQDGIVAQGPATTLVFTGSAANLAIDYMMSLETASLAQGQHVTQADPSFVDPANGDFHLLPTSLAIDYAPPVSGDDRDLDGLPHDQDMPGVPNQFGVRDLGAYERQLRYCGGADTIFCSGFDFD